MIGGLGRTTLRSEVAFASPDGTNSKDSGTEGFLGQWLTDSSAVVAFRDWRYALVGPSGKLQSGSMPGPSAAPVPLPAETVAYITSRKAIVWLEHRHRITLLQTHAGPIGRFKGLLALSAVLSTSPDGRYLAVGGQGPFLYEDHHLQIFDTESGTWTDLGPLTIHPDPDWDYTKPNWSPWFPDSKRLAFFSRGVLCVKTADGREARELLHVRDGGLATVSPRGGSIAYATFVPRRERQAPYRQIWGGTTLWTVAVFGGVPAQITTSSEQETLALRWLSEEALIFDRVGEGMFNESGRIWKVSTNMK